MMLIVADIHERTGLPKEYVSETLRGFKELVKDNMVAGIDTDLGGDFGKFTAIEVASREHYVPARGTTTQTPARRKIRFRPAPKMRNLPPIDSEETALQGEPAPDEEIKHALEEARATIKALTPKALVADSIGAGSRRAVEAAPDRHPFEVAVGSVFDDLDLTPAEESDRGDQPAPVRKMSETAVPRPRKTKKKKVNAVWTPDDIK